MKEVENVIESYATYIEKLPTGCMMISEQLREGNIQGSLDNIKNFTDGLLWLMKAKELLESNGVVIKFSILDIQKHLNEINNGLEVEDYFLVADLFEYEMVPYFQSLNSYEN